MNRLFSKSEIYALKDRIKKKKNTYIHRTETHAEEIQKLNNLYNAVLGMEQNMNKSKQEKTLK